MSFSSSDSGTFPRKRIGSGRSMLEPEAPAKQRNLWARSHRASGLVQRKVDFIIDAYSAVLPSILADVSGAVWRLVWLWNGGANYFQGWMAAEHGVLRGYAASSPSILVCRRIRWGT
ncbi:MAG: hypothetical protein LWW92_10570 [Rhodocyclales bacterium]|nr:hypothetical protein [Rhodocyclales bacterium]